MILRKGRCNHGVSKAPVEANPDLSVVVTWWNFKVVLKFLSMLVNTSPYLGFHGRAGQRTLEWVAYNS